MYKRVELSIGLSEEQSTIAKMESILSQIFHFLYLLHLEVNIVKMEMAHPTLREWVI